MTGEGCGSFPVSRNNRGRTTVSSFTEHTSDARNSGLSPVDVDYLHFNPVKHGHVGSVAEWPYSTFHKLVAIGDCPSDWAGGSADGELDYLD